MEKPVPDTSSGAPFADKDIFKEVFFAVIPTKDLKKEDAEKIIQDLTSHGATHCPLSSSELRHVTHLIATTSDFPAYHDAVEGFIHVVRPLWVQQSLLKNKASNPRQFSPDPSFFLSDVVVMCADDIPEGDKDAIIGGLYSMGGQYSPGLTKLVTHVVALSMDNPQCKVVVDRKLKCKLVLPHWFDACLRLGKKINHKPYLHPNPSILLNTNERPTWTYDNLSNDLKGATHFEPPSLPDTLTPPASPSKERRELAVLRKKTVFLHKDLKLSSRLTQSLADIIKKAEGSIVNDIEDADMLVCQYRDSQEFVSASRAGKDVGNLSWLYYLINHNTWTSPTRRLLHYPFPKNGIEGFDAFRISVSNYTGEARIYLESLVKAAGGHYTKAMAPENTHLITAHTFSEKCTAAREWNIHTVNHLWLEESYAKCKVQSVTIPRYTTFPERTNLGEVVGQTPINRKAVEKMHFPPNDEEEMIGGHLEPLEVNSSAVRTPAAKTSKRETKNIATQTPLPSLWNNNIASTPGSRGAKDRALSKLHMMAPDIALFEKETKRVGGVVYGGRRVTDPDRIVLNNGANGRKRHSSEADAEMLPDRGDDHESVEPEDVSQPKKKKAKTVKQAAANILTSEPLLKVLITGYDKDGLKATSNIKSKLSGLNVSIVEDPTTDFDILAAPKIMRTRKFLIAIAAAPTLVNVSWLEDMANLQKRLPADRYALQDPETEKSAGFKLRDAVKRAKKNKERGGMLRGYAIFCTESVKAGFETYEGIVKANGGDCFLFKGRSTAIPQAKKKRQRQRQQRDGNDIVMSDAAAEDDQDDNNNDDDDEEQHHDTDAANGAKPNEGRNHLYLITDTKEKDKALWPKFKEMAITQGYDPRLVKPDWLLRIAQSQDVGQWMEEWEYV